MQTAPEQQAPSQPAMEPQFEIPRRGVDRRILLIGAVIIILIASGLYIYGSGKSIIPHTTTTILAGPGELASCTAIKAPGNYEIESEIKTTMQSGACINVTADDVHIMCSNGLITGSGPYSGVPPFTYGIEFSGASNDSVSGCIIKNFSYGIYAPSSEGLRIYDNNVSVNYLSNIYLKGAHNSSVYSNFMSGSASTEGSLYITGNSTGNRVVNNTILRNQYYGISVNSTGNLFLVNHVNASPVSFYCSISGGLAGSNIGNSNICLNSTGCGFIRCSGTNIPPDLSQLRLGSSISSCGSITMPGSYALTGNVDMGAYVNVSAEQGYGIPCISVKSNNVALDCKGFGVFNSTTGISAYNASNVTVSDCNAWNSTVGMALASTMASNVRNFTSRNDGTGLMLKGSSGDILSNVKAYYGTYGAYLLNSSTDTFQGFNFSGNRYGIYVNKSIGEAFSNGAAVNNLQSDVYATPDSAAASYSIMLSSACGLTNAQWAPCGQHTMANMSNYPISSCSNLYRAGNYTLTSNILNGQAACMDITASNVLLNCLSHSITAAYTTLGPAIHINQLHAVVL